MSARIGVYPGTFDPITNGHMDVVGRATRVVDRLIVAVARNAGKTPLFNLEERVEMAREEADHLPEGAGARIEVRAFENLLVHFVDEVGGSMIVRGLRAVSDFEYEFQMAAMNARINSRIETIFLPAAESTQFIASRFVKEIAQLGGDISSFVSPRVESRIRAKFGFAPTA